MYCCLYGTATIIYHHCTYKYTQFLLATLVLFFQDKMKESPVVKLSGGKKKQPFPKQEFFSDGSMTSCILS